MGFEYIHRKRDRAKEKAGCWRCPYCKGHYVSREDHIKDEHFMSVKEFEEMLNETRNTQKT